MNAGAMLIDAGEGTYHQLLRHVHGDQQKLDHLLSEIQLIWISHKHADHHLGLNLLLSKRARLIRSMKSNPTTATATALAASNVSPIVIVCPSPIIGWLTENSNIDPDLRNTFICVPCVKTATVYPPQQFINRRRRQNVAATASGGASTTSSMGATGSTATGSINVTNTAHRRPMGTAISLSSVHDPLRNVLNELELLSLESVAVDHCHLSYGVVIVSKTGWKLVFSGDTTPDRRLWERGNNATLLIHEATFDSDMVADAKKKKHSTVAGAIDVGQRMNAKHLILTHFSQRYPKLPVLRNEEKAKTRLSNVSVSFDLMSVRMSQLEWLPRMLPALQHMFPDVGDEGAL
jgi:ribonuclease Z